MLINILNYLLKKKKKNSDVRSHMFSMVRRIFVVY